MLRSPCVILKLQSIKKLQTETDVRQRKKNLHSKAPIVKEAFKSVQHIFSAHNKVVKIRIYTGNFNQIKFVIYLLLAENRKHIIII